MTFKALRLMGDRILVKMDPEKDTVAGGVLFKPDDAYETILRTGVVTQVGPGKWTKDGKKRMPVGVEVGEGVVFNRFIASDTKTAQALHGAVLEPDEGLLDPKDILVVYDRKEGIEIT
jgi:co-chaperonin GroES (HSP10)